ncbi:hypothetical protein Cgig2_007844 [Carnegiea gigantea]|uniref:RING-type E3 ubiquitin transferase n=1 Tax=Carnegiea gigantea TaxID=171969 RepID=A0A9Q1GX44_9CARY|nr:hypothetical protein Cgig2_007844 [Carnegiea gigantea]
MPCSCFQLNADTTPITSIAKSLLASLSEITTSAGSAKIEQNNFLEIGSYFYRVSQAIEEIQTSGNTKEHAVRALESLSERTDSAKAILVKLQQSAENISDNEAHSMIKQLEVIINRIGDDLGVITPSTFRDEIYAETVIQSLSEEMKRAQFEIHETSETKPDNQQTWPSYLEEHPNTQSIAGSDLYSISTEVRTKNSHVSDIPQILEALTSASQRNHRRHRKMSNASEGSVMEAAQFMEPAYKSFFCPLTTQIMDDPVTIQSGVTYERKAITEYFESFGNPEEVVCPTTKEKLQNMAMSPNIALRHIIKEWKDRNETAQLKGIHAVLSVGGTEAVILEAIKNLQNICLRSPKKIIEVRDIGITTLLVRLLELKDRAVRCAALEMIYLLAKEDEGKELIGGTPAISTTMRMLSSSYQPIRHAALLLLIELSKSQSLAEKMGLVTGGILMLIQTKYHRCTDTFASEAADQVLRNMEQCPNNIKLMVEYGYLEPLLNNLIQGSEERKLEMATYLSEIILEDDNKTYVAERASPVLIHMLHSGDLLSRKAVFKALLQISSYHPNGKILVDAGIVQILVEEMFKKQIHNESMDSVREASGILANILESGAFGLALKNLPATKQGHTMASGYVVFNIIYMIRNSTPDDLNLNLIRILTCLIKSTKSAAPVVSAVKESDASYILVELLSNPSHEIATAAIKLLTLLSSHIGHLLIERLCKTHGLPEDLIQSPAAPGQITERQALSVSFLAKLPHQNLTLNMALLSKNTVPKIVESINQAQQSGARQNRYTSLYLEGLVGILVRFTATLYDSQMLFLAINHNFTTMLTDLVAETSSDEVLRLAAAGLEKLSSQSIHLTQPPKLKRERFLNLFCLPQSLASCSSSKIQIQLCPVHKGVCSKQDTFCLIEAKAVPRLLACLDHRNVEVVESTLSAISTLLDDKVDVERSVNLLNAMNATQQVLKAVRHHKNESLWQKAFWIIERFLLKGGQSSISLVSQDRMFAISVVTAFHHGEAYTRQMAEKILRYLDKMPTLSATATFTA